MKNRNKKAKLEKEERVEKALRFESTPIPADASVYGELQAACINRA